MEPLVNGPEEPYTVSGGPPADGGLPADGRR
jgi:hypothetical protein